jgi:hydroxypyruvate isomerase
MPPMRTSTTGREGEFAGDKRPGIRCSANVSFLFPGIALPAALFAAHDAGFRTVELLDPYALPEGELVAIVRRLGLKVDHFNLPMGDFRAGERGLAGDPRRADEFLDGLERARRLAHLLHPAKVNALAGARVRTLSVSTQLAYLADQLARTAAVFEPLGTQVVTELLNPIETPGFLLSSLARTKRVLSALGGRVGFQLDVYQLQRSGANLIDAVRAMSSLTAHVQIADAPSRSEPGSGVINMPPLLRAIVASGYRGLVGLEYSPSRKGLDPFAWMESMGCVRG